MTDNSSSPARLTRPRRRPALPWNTRLSVSFLSIITDSAQRSDGSVNRRLLSLLDYPGPPSRRPHKGVRTADVTVDPSRPLWFRLFVPTASTGARLPVIVFFHGGGFAFLSADSRPYDAVGRRFARKLPAVVVSVNYRLAPEHRCPAPYDDGADVLRFLDSGGLSRADSAAAELADLSRCFLAGDSAGANIAHHVGRRWAADATWAKVRVCGMVLIQPYFGGEERTESEIKLEGAPLVSMARTDWCWKAFLPEGSDRDHPAANVFGPKAVGELEERFPPAMVVIGGYDPLGDWQRRYCQGLRERGKEVKVVEFPESVHAFYALPGQKESAGRLVEEMREFMEGRKGGGEKKGVELEEEEEVGDDGKFVDDGSSKNASDYDDDGKFVDDGRRNGVCEDGEYSSSGAICKTLESWSTYMNG